MKEDYLDGMGVVDILTDALHQDFGWLWQADPGLAEVLNQNWDGGMGTMEVFGLFSECVKGDIIKE